MSELFGGSSGRPQSGDEGKGTGRLLSVQHGSDMISAVERRGETRPERDSQ